MCARGKRRKTNDEQRMKRNETKKIVKKSVDCGDSRKQSRPSPMISYDDGDDAHNSHVYFCLSRAYMADYYYYCIFVRCCCREAMSVHCV